jgi:hypothetical protein
LTAARSDHGTTAPRRRSARTTDPTPDGTAADPGRLVVGILADEGLPATTAEALVDDLPGLLTHRLSDQVEWDVRVEVQVLALDEQGEIPMIRLAEQQRESSGWDLAVLLTDLPRRAGTQPIVSDYSAEHGVALLSFPALGALALRHRARDLLVHLVGHLAQDRLALDDKVVEEGTRRGVSGRLANRLAPTRHIDADADHIDRHLALLGLRGRARLLGGMIRDNRPWRLVPHLSSATAAAAATAAYGVITGNFWSIADNLPPWRLAVINVIAVLAMTLWLLFYNHLWDRPADRTEREKAVLDNVATLVTLVLGVICMYVILYVITLCASLIVLDSGYFSRQLGHPAGFAGYATITWLACSVGIAAGALGSSFESEQAVRKATYSRREQARRESRYTRDEDDDKGRGTRDRSETSDGEHR